MDSLAAVLLSIFTFLIWLAGIVLAKGFWLTVAAIFTPYGAYLVVERLLIMAGWVV